MDESGQKEERRLRLLIEYEGTDFVGWQIQPDGRSVQEAIQQAFRQFTASDAVVVGSGRTDSGVHARGQVAHVIVRTGYSCKKIHEALNGILPEDIAIIKVEDTDDSFHARYSAKQRHYSYTISTSPSAIERRTTWFIRYPISIESMNKCASEIIGEHDFFTFTKSESGVKHHNCIVTFAEWSEKSGRFVFHIKANRFLHNMVRSLVGSMVEVGRGYATVENFIGAFKSKDRSKAGQTAPSRGLILEEVVYE